MQPRPLTFHETSSDEHVQNSETIPVPPRTFNYLSECVLRTYLSTQKRIAQATSELLASLNTVLHMTFFLPE